ncbi:hypothetical protein DCAR_0623999 [Daucus carota subsp. sativus]|uniref:Uncharacterized protein n=1 Tax=Daucus carota subsp. sativus TaxID=79200 RepID=A0A164VKE9_DAUCS|nr:hypothetical protein DCAR_0623999 [Daucus carota subsp. sativus]
MDWFMRPRKEMHKYGLHECPDYKVATSIFAFDSLGISTIKLKTPSPTCNGISCQGETYTANMLISLVLATRQQIRIMVSLWSIRNFLGRFGAGYVSDVYLQKRGWPRPVFMILTLATMASGHLVIASGFPGNLCLGSVIVGVVMVLSGP